MSLSTEKPVVTAAQITAAVGLVWPAILIVCTAFGWDLSEEQVAALTGLAGAITTAVGLLTGKAAASRVYVPSSVDRVIEERTVGLQAEADERVRIAESFGRPDQNQGPAITPQWGAIGGRRDP